MHWNMRHRADPVSPRRLLLTAVFAAGIVLMGCSDSGVFTGELTRNISPVIDLTSGPMQGDTIAYSIHFFWLGEDEDGEIDHYEFCMVEGDPVGFDPADTTGADKWNWTELTDSLFTVIVDDYDHDIQINKGVYGQFQKVYTFFIKAVDDRGATSPTVFRSFTAFTLAPHIYITSPVLRVPYLGAQVLSTVTTFKWYGKDPIDAPWNYQEVDSTRFLWTYWQPNLLTTLNNEPEKLEYLWSDWEWYYAEGDSGRQTTLGDDEFLEPNTEYIIAIQAKDEAGAVSSIFDRTSNVMHFRAMLPVGPTIRVQNSYLGTFTYVGTEMDPKNIDVPSGFEINFNWEGDASGYGGLIQSYRYGWDIVNPDEPAEWDVSPSPYIVSSMPKTFYSGVHTFYIEAADNLGTRTFGRIEITVVPMLMERDLLLVDDFPSSDFTQSVYAFPTESEHDDFWKKICLKVSDFDLVTDTYDVAEHAYKPPPMRQLWRYKNVIWTFSNAIDPITGSTWNWLVYYTPEGSQTPLTLNFLKYYLRSGGHLWTVGEGHRRGNLSSCVYTKTFPCNLRCEFYGPSEGCGSRTGLGTMAYEDFCVTVLDKADGSFNVALGVDRRLDYDPMRYARLDHSDPVTASLTGLPERLELWEETTKPKRFFEKRGFNYIEVYDPAYYMHYTGSLSQSCFHPMYRNVALNGRSVIHDAAVVFLHNRYSHVVAPADGCVGAPSVHFGFPLWFFKREQVDSLASAIFGMWQLEQVTDE
jgi:hypothetical protein